MGSGPSLGETSLSTISPSATTIILLSTADTSLNGVPYNARLSTCMLDTLFRNSEVNFPSSKTATGILLFLNFSSSGVFLFSFVLINAGVPIVLELGEEDNNIVLVIPVAVIVSIEFTNRPAT